MIGNNEETMKLKLTVVVRGAVGVVDDVAAVTDVASSIRNNIIFFSAQGLFGSIPAAINSMRNSVVVANHAARPLIRNPFNLFLQRSLLFFSRIFSRITTSSLTATR